MKVVSESRSRPALVGHRLALEVAGLLSFIKFLPPHQVNDELFFVEQDRKVNADNTFSLKAIRFEAGRKGASEAPEELCKCRRRSGPRDVCQRALCGLGKVLLGRSRPGRAARLWRVACIQRCMLRLLASGCPGHGNLGWQAATKNVLECRAHSERICCAWREVLVEGEDQQIGVIPDLNVRWN